MTHAPDICLKDSRARDSRHRLGPTMIHWAAFSVGLALLAAASIPIYRSVRIRAIETEMVRAMSFVKLAQDRYYAEHGRYAGKSEAFSVTEDVGLDLGDDNFPPLRHLRFEDLFMSVNQPEGDAYRLFWVLPEFSGSLGLNVRVRSMNMDQDGNVF